MAKILFVGCGELGSAVGNQLAAAGHQCFGLRRQCNQLPDAFQAVPADVTRAETLQHLPPALDYLVYTLTPAGFDPQSYRQAYVQGLDNIITALQQQGQQLRRLLYVSSSAVYHQHQGEWVDENSDTEPSGFSGQAMLAAEQLLQAGPYPGTSVRFSGIYGPGRERLIDWARQGVSCPRTPPHYSNRIHRDDCVGVLKHLLELDMRGQPLDSIYLASDPNPASFADILDWLRQQTGIGHADPQQAITKRLRAGNKRCCSQRLLDSGYRFKYPDYRAGFKAMLDAG